ncbi:sulfite exporter TauE/SafE family protein [Methylicorpusculum oleiharenae]|uniref:sulfite exporter TauE/SafE family protein n=1 Tax=Methylicorpusculum oleiharenae TaxID=1338687 RepID=UPI001E5832AD|nr:sulfite exporter TauE/SafE family protein [Methylicorpusculum oleiharenae]MCD2449801.1 sulfite exporter TauE/SafE family protein [Methylicorpusculum oleiharenae]
MKRELAKIAQIISGVRVIEIIVISMLTGVLAGFLGGLLGIGGGLIIVPVLLIVFKHQGFEQEIIMITAVATSLASVIFTALASSLAHHRLGTLNWNKALQMVPGIVIGVLCGAMLAERLVSNWLETVYAIFLIMVGMQMAFQLEPKQGTIKKSGVLDFVISWIIGLVSSLVGIGGGTLTVPYLVSCRYPMRNAVAISSACGIPIAFAGALSYLVLGWNVGGMPTWSLGYIYLPAFVGIVVLSMPAARLGARWAYKLPAKHLKRYFSLLIFFMAAKLLFQ